MRDRCRRCSPRRGCLREEQALEGMLNVQFQTSFSSDVLRPSSSSVKSRAPQPKVLGDTGQGETEQQGAERGREEPRFEPSEKPLLGKERRRPGRLGEARKEGTSSGVRSPARSGQSQRVPGEGVPDWSGEALLKRRHTGAGTTAGQQPRQGRKPSGQTMGGRAAGSTRSLSGGTLQSSAEGNRATVTGDAGSGEP